MWTGKYDIHLHLRQSLFLYAPSPARLTTFQADGISFFYWRSCFDSRYLLWFNNYFLGEQNEEDRFSRLATVLLTLPLVCVEGVDRFENLECFLPLRKRLQPTWWENKWEASLPQFHFKLQLYPTMVIPGTHWIPQNWMFHPVKHRSRTQHKT